MNYGRFIKHCGKIAHTFGWETDQDRPIQKRRLKVSSFSTGDFPLLADAGHYITSLQENTFIVQHSQARKPMRVDTSNWEVVWEEKPISKPKKGRNKTYGDYDWEWVFGQWVRKLL